MRGQSVVDRMRHGAGLAACAVAFSASVGAAPQYLSPGALVDWNPRVSSARQ